MDYMAFFTPHLMSAILAGYAIRNPANMAICIIHQNIHEVLESASCGKIRKIAIAINPYMPICQAVRDSMSALKAFSTALVLEIADMLLMAAY